MAYERLWRKIASFPERDLNLVMVGYLLALADQGEFPVILRNGAFLTEDGVRLLVSDLMRRVAMADLGRPDAKTFVERYGFDSLGVSHES